MEQSGVGCPLSTSEGELKAFPFGRMPHPVRILVLKLRILCMYL
jgi:hypothetical protein